VTAHDDPNANQTQPWSTAPPVVPPPPAPPLAGYAQPPAGDWRRMAGPLPGSVVAAAVILLVMGTIVTLFGLLVFLSVGLIGSLPAELANDPAFNDPIFNDPAFEGQTFEEMMDMAQAGILVMGGIVLVFAVLHFVAGIGVLKRRNWARIIGLVMAGLAIVLTGVWLLLTLLAVGSQPIPGSVPGMSPEAVESMMRTTMIVVVVIGVVVLAAYGYAFFALISRGRDFSRPLTGWTGQP
jgi:hypothetical protein